ncbi:hypothetical protein [Streptomyces axinellae]|uniref:Actin-fragmin kinase catalytic domain-containing protein n=1 Tax=Streptomyces axinellae TaxID=552788 RepID=A0ABN3PRS2_9ACTN
MAVKAMQFSAAEVAYADKFIKHVGGIKVPESRVYESSSAEGRALSEILSTAKVDSERRAGELKSQTEKAAHYVVMEVVQAMPLSKSVRDLDYLTALARDETSMQEVGRLIAMDSFLGSADRLVFRDYSEHPADRLDPINLDNIMHSPERGIVAIDNEFLPVDESASISDSPNVQYLSALGNKDEVDLLAYSFLSRLERQYRRANGISPEQRIETLASSLGEAHNNVVDGIYAGLSKIAADAVGVESNLAQAQLSQFPRSAAGNWSLGDVARYANLRFSGIDVSREPSLSHEAALVRLAATPGQQVSAARVHADDTNQQVAAAAAHLIPSGAPYSMRQGPQAAPSAKPSGPYRTHAAPRGRGRHA